MRYAVGHPNLLDGVYRDEMIDATDGWRLPELPDLRAKGITEIFMDLESEGLRWWDGHRQIGSAILYGDRCDYFPIRHRVGPNIPEETYFRWKREQLRGVKITNINLRFDLHLERMDGIDLDEQGCTFGDVAHYAALCDDHRRRFNQKELAEDLLGDETGKVTQVGRFELDPSRFADYPAGLIAPRACHDVLTVKRLRDHLWPILTAQDLHRVRELEEQVIPAVVEMEHNGAPIDIELLNLWCEETEAKLQAGLFELQRLTGVAFPTADNRDAVRKLFHAIGRPAPEDESGSVSFADALLIGIDHPAVQLLRQVKQLASVRSKFLLKYQRSAATTGILRYALNQLPYQDAEDGEGGGAVSGRFSSAALSRDEGANIQQVFGGRQSKKEAIKEYPIRRLFRTRDGRPWFASDASQIEYRMFGSLARSKAIIEAYRTDAGTDYHELVQQLIRKFTGQDLLREDVKAINFAQVYGAGVRKLARQLGVPEDQIPPVNAPRHEKGGPEYQRVVGLSKRYHELFPEVKPLLRQAAHVAMPRCLAGLSGECYHPPEVIGLPHRGYVRTMLGRRRRFGDHDRYYSALNGVIQGSAADWNKRVLVEVHKHRKELTLQPFFTVHDEWDGALGDRGKLPRIREIFNEQYYPLNVPIVWEMGVGETWHDAKAKGNRV